MTLSHRNDVSIALVILYIPSVLIAIFLAVRHGFTRNSGWLFLIIFCLARIIGSCMELATISNPTSVSLYTGSAILSNVGLSPLLLATLGLLSRLLDNINKTHSTMVTTRMLKLIELVVSIALILGIVGGIDASDDLQKTGTYKLGTLSKAGTSLFIVCYVLIFLATIVTSFSVSHASEGEKRILLAIIIALPFLGVRLVYSICSSLANLHDFNLMTGSVTLLVCVAYVEEFVVVVVYEIMGCTLGKVEKIEHVEGARMIPSQDSAEQRDYGNGGMGYENGGMGNVENKRVQGGQGGQENAMLGLAKKTIIGRVVMGFVPKDGEEVEMRGQRRGGRRERRARR